MAALEAPATFGVGLSRRVAEAASILGDHFGVCAAIGAAIRSDRGPLFGMGYLGVHRLSLCGPSRGGYCFGTPNIS